MVLRKTNRWRQFSRGTNTPIIASSTKRPKLPLPGGSNRFATQVRGASKTIPLACEAAAHSVHPDNYYSVGWYGLTSTDLHSPIGFCGFTALLPDSAKLCRTERNC